VSGGFSRSRAAAASISAAVIGEILAKHLGVRDLTGVFPGFDNNPRKFAGLIKT